MIQVKLVNLFQETLLRFAKNKNKITKLKTEKEEKKGEKSFQFQVPKPQEIKSANRHTVHIITQEENMMDSADFRHW